MFSGEFFEIMGLKKILGGGGGRLIMNVWVAQHKFWLTSFEAEVRERIMLRLGENIIFFFNGRGTKLLNL